MPSTDQCINQYIYSQSLCVDEIRDAIRFRSTKIAKARSKPIDSRVGLNYINYIKLHKST